MTVEPWTTLGETTVVRDRWIDLRRQHCRTPSGQELDDYYVQHCPDWVTVVAVTEQGRFLRVRQWRQGARVVSLELPGGVIDPGETPETAGARELLEETGFRGDPPSLLACLWANPSTQSNRTHTVLITGCRYVAEPTLELTEALEMDEADPAVVLGDVRSGAMSHALHTVALLLAQLHRPDLFDGALQAGCVRP